MKNFRITFWSVVSLFFLVMGIVVAVCYIRPSHQTRLDPARIRYLRDLTKKS